MATFAPEHFQAVIYRTNRTLHVLVVMHTGIMSQASMTDNRISDEKDQGNDKNRRHGVLSEY